MHTCSWQIDKYMCIYVLVTQKKKSSVFNIWYCIQGNIHPWFTPPPPPLQWVNYLLMDKFFLFLNKDTNLNEKIKDWAIESTCKGKNKQDKNNLYTVTTKVWLGLVITSILSIFSCGAAMKLYFFSQETKGTIRYAACR